MPLFLLVLLLLAAAPIAAQAPTHTFSSTAPTLDGLFGHTLSGVPDADGDGVGDVLVGAFFENAGGRTDAGRAYLFSGATGALLRTLTSPTPTASGQFGGAVAGVPDVNGDGRGDLLVAAKEESGAAGRVYLFSGATGALLRTFQSPAPLPNGRFGLAVAVVPNAAGDGRPGIAVSARDEDLGGGQRAGRVYLFAAATGALLHTFASPNRSPDAQFGFHVASVAGVPDADGDGRGDVLVGAPGEAVGETRTVGRAYLFSSGSGALLRTFQTPNPVFNGQFGLAVVGVPDADGDGRGDVLIGAPTERVGDVQSGRAYLFSAATGALLRTLTSPTPAPNGHFGVALADAGDADGDGRSDLLVGARYETVGVVTEAGRVHLFSGATGAALGAVTSPDTRMPGSFGVAVAAVPGRAGEPNALAAGAPFESVNGVGNAGRAYLFRASSAVSREAPPGEAAFAVTLAPNPARGAALISLALGRPEPVAVEVFDALGRRVALLHDGLLPAGPHGLRLDAAHLPGGVYLVRVRAGAAERTRPLVLVR